MSKARLAFLGTVPISLLVFWGLSNSTSQYDYTVTLCFFGFWSVATALVVSQTDPFEKRTVDYIYYTVGIVGVLLFSISRAAETKKFDVPIEASDLSSAVSNNFDEIYAAYTFALKIESGSKDLLEKINSHLRDFSPSEPKNCYEEYRNYESGEGSTFTDQDGMKLRYAHRLSLRSPERLAQVCIHASGGFEPVSLVQMLYYLFPRAKAPIAINDFSEVASILPFLLDFKLEKESLPLRNFVEYLIDEYDEILSSEKILKIIETDAGSLPPINFVVFEKLFSTIQGKFALVLDVIAWPFVLIFLLSLKISANRASSTR